MIYTKLNNTLACLGMHIIHFNNTEWLLMLMNVLLRFIGEVLVCKEENGYEPRHSFDVSIYNHNCNMHYGQ